MRKFRILLILLAVLLQSYIAHSDEAGISHYWINNNIEWEHPNTGDPQIDKITYAATIVSILFSDNGQFRMISTNGTLGDDGIIYQDAEIFNIWVGNWRVLGKDKIEIEYYHASRFIPIKGDKLDFVPQKEILEIKSIAENKQFHFLHWDFIEATKLSQREKDRLSKLANTDPEKLKDKS